MMIKKYLEAEPAQNSYSVDGFIAKDNPMLKSYSEIQDKFEAIDKLYAEQKKESLEFFNRHPIQTEEMLKKEKKVLQEKVKKQEERLKELRVKVRDIRQSFDGSSVGDLPKEPQQPTMGKSPKIQMQTMSTSASQIVNELESLQVKK